MKKILKVENPILTTYPESSHVLSIIKSQPNYKSWLFNNFIQLFGTQWNENVYDVNWYFPHFWRMEDVYFHCPLIDYQRIQRSFISFNHFALHDFIKKCLDNHLYITTNVNERFFSFSQAYGRDFTHPPLIYGYDNDEKLYYLSDNFGNGSYQQQTCSFDEFEKAFTFHDIGDESLIHLISINHRESDYFDYDLIKNSISDYLNSSNNSIKLQKGYNGYEFPSPNPPTFGVSIYNDVIKNLENIKCNSSFPRKKVFHCLWSHKALMLERIKYLGERGVLKNVELHWDRYYQIERKSYAALMLILKYMATNQVAILDEIIKMMWLIYWEEQQELEQLTNDFIN